MRHTLGVTAGIMAAAALLAGCGKTYPVSTVVPTATPIKPYVSSVYIFPTPTASPATSPSAEPIGIASAASTSNCASEEIWFTLERTDQVGFLNDEAKYEFYTLPNPGSEPYGIACGINGFMWFTEYAGDRIGTFDASTSTFTEYSIPTTDSEPTAIVLGSDNGLWFTESNTGKIGRIDQTSDAITETSLTGGSATEPFDATLGPDENIWFTLEGSDQIGVITPSYGVTLYNVPTASAEPYAIISAENELWFTEENAGKIGSITTNTGTVTEVTLTACPHPQSLVFGVDSNFYIFCSGQTTFVQYDPFTGAQTSYDLRSGSVAQWSILGFDQKIYFTDSGLNAITQISY